MKPFNVTSTLTIVTLITLLCLPQESATQPKEPNDDITCSRYLEVIAMALPISSNPSKHARVTFRLFTRNYPLGKRFRKKGGLPQSYDPSKETKFIIHGFLGKPTLPWIERLTEALLERSEVNVITVNWSSLAAVPYMRAVMNAPLVGAQITKLVDYILKTGGGDAGKFHLIGHSLGAQIAGYAGQRIVGLGRITGLDPAGPLFTDNSPIDRLDPGDAVFVDAIHTNSKCFGISVPSGHVDFYPNGGKEQPGCVHVDFPRHSILDNVFEIFQSATCSHFRATELFTESISTSNRTCKFIGLQCDSYDNFQKEHLEHMYLSSGRGTIHPSTENNTIEGSCAITEPRVGSKGLCNEYATDETKIAFMGIEAYKYAGRDAPFNQTRKFYLNTLSVDPFCAKQDFCNEGKLYEA